MDKPTRAKLIIDQVLALDQQFGRTIPPRSLSGPRTRLISNDDAWEARWSLDYEQDQSGHWDLFELSVHGQPALAAVVRGELVLPRFFIPGTWERIFIPFDNADTVPLLPN